jgi:capsular polysaccharide biosynthesis protein
MNEQNLISVLSDKGVEIIVAGRHSIEEQIGIFARARVVIGPHGAGLTNIAFCCPGTTLYEIMGDRLINPCYANLAHSLGMNYCVEAFPCHGKEPGRDEWSVDLEEVVATIEKLDGAS